MTGIAVPQPADSELAYDARFSPLFQLDSDGDGGVSGGNSAEKDVEALLLHHSSGAGPAAMLDDAVAVVGSKLERTQRLPDPIEAGKSLSSYGLDSLSCIELRNWIRMELGVDVKVVEITNASSLTVLGEKAMAKMRT